MPEPNSARSNADHPDAHCADCPFSDRGDWVMYRDEYEALYGVLRDLVSAYMAGDDLAPVVKRAEELTGGQQNGS